MRRCPFTDPPEYASQLLTIIRPLTLETAMQALNVLLYLTILACALGIARRLYNGDYR